MILVLDATATDPAGNVLSGSVAVTVIEPAAETPAQEQVAVPQPGESPQPQLAPFQQRSIMMSRQWGA